MNFYSSTMKLPQDTEDIIAKKPAVLVEYSRELSYPCWAVTLEEDTEYWLWTFSTKAAALNFCKARDLTVVDVIEDM